MIVFSQKLQAIIFVIVLIVLNTQTINASEISPNVVGYSFNHTSNALNYTFNVKIHLPENYQDSKQKYPVLYILDGQRYFLHGVSYQQTFRFQNMTPEMIIVGLSFDNNRDRRQFLNSNSKQFTQYLANELVPYINKSYRTIGENLYFGWQMAGGLAIELLSEKPNLFSAYLVSSPTFITQNRLDKLAKTLEANTLDVKTNALFVTIGASETWALGETQSLNNLATQHPKKLMFNYQELEGENHYSTPLISFNSALQQHFEDYLPLRFENVAAFEDFGGISALQAYFSHRGKRYGLSEAIDDNTIHYLFNLAVNQKDYVFFTMLDKTFSGFILRRYERENWIKKFGQFYLQNDNFKSALTLYNKGLKLYPSSNSMNEGALAAKAGLNK